MTKFLSRLAPTPPSKPARIDETNKVLSEIIDALEKAKNATDKNRRFELIDEAYENLLVALIYHESE